MSKRFLSLTGIGMITAAIGLFAFASSAFAAANIESLKLTSPNIITIVYSEPVYTSPSDYTNFTGSFAGEEVNSVNGSGSNTITLNLSNAESSGANGYITIGTNVQDVSDSQYFGGATWNIVSSIGPALTSFGMSSNEENGSFAGTNDAITVTFNTNEQVNVLNMNIAGHTVAVNGGGTGPFTATYTMESGDNQQSIPVTLTLSDNSNNQTNLSFSYNNNGTTSSGSTNDNAIIASIVSNANTTGVLTNGDSITFTLTPTTSEPNAHIAGSYNGVPLSWTTTNSGVNYVATYIVESDQPSQSSPLQISGVTLTDQYGNVSAPASGYDIQKTISVTDSGTTAVTTATTTDLATEIQSLENQLTQLQTQVSGGTTSGTTTGTVGTMPAQHTFTEFLNVGSQDAEVTALQQWLTYYGVYSGPITGFYGTLTQTAVENFQSAHGIDVKGYVGPSTRAALNAGE